MERAWERLIKSVKDSLHSVLKKHAPKEETLITVLAEFEHSINLQPLTHVPTDLRDQEALTPNHFLISSSSSTNRLGRYDMQAFSARQQ